MADNRAIFVYGAGISGQGVAEVLADQGEEVVLYNDTDVDLEPEWYTAFGAVGGLFMTEVDPTDELKRSKLMIISPGIPFTTDTVKKARELGVEIIGEAEEASRLYKGKWIGITGTNGKTTTTTLVGEMLDTLPVKTAVAGNIGRSLSKEVINLDADSYVAAELSSFQLEGVTTMRVNIALIVNITPDHFERHGNMENYINAKGRVVFFSAQKQLDEGTYIEDGWFVLNLDGKKQRILQVSDMKIFGSHNEQNVLGALCCAYFAGVTPENMAKVLKNFQGVEHRLEYVTTIKGVPYYNDSKATNTDSAVKAMEAFKDGHVILLAGGHDKLTDLTEFMQVAARQTDALILLGEARQRFYEAAVKNGVKNIYMIDGSFDDAVNKAASLAQPPEVVLLSPACSSYDMFDNYPQRGRYFKELVRKLEKQQENA